MVMRKADRFCQTILLIGAVISASSGCRSGAPGPVQTAFENQTANSQPHETARQVVVDKGDLRHVDLFAGIRYWHLGNDLNLSAGSAPAASASASKNWVDPILGTRLQLNLSPKLFVAGKADLGRFGAGSDTTWQLLAVGDITSAHATLF